MRSSCVFLSLFLLASLVMASPQPCSDHPGVVHGATGGKARPRKPRVKETARRRKHKVPKVRQPTRKSLSKDAQHAIEQFAGSNLLPPRIAEQLASALAEAIKAQVAPPPVTVIEKLEATSVATSVSTSIQTVFATATNTLTINGSTSIVTTTLPASTLRVQVPVNRTVTETAFATVVTAVDSSASNAINTAALNIQKALDSAFAAAQLSQQGLNNATVAALEACLTTVLANGGMPDGYSCLTASGSNSAGLEATLNTILEQFVGILPNTILSSVFDAISPTLTSLLPASESALVEQIQDSIQSVIASLSGNSVTALEQVQGCYTAAIQQQGNTSSLQCFNNGGGSTLRTAMNAVIENFVGVLPASLVTSVQNIMAYNFQNITTEMDTREKLAARVQAQISNALSSAAATISGNSVTLAEVLQACATDLILTGNGTAAALCVAQGKAPTLSMTTVLGIAEQYQGYLPSSFFSDLVAASESLIANSSLNPTNASQAIINGAFDSFFNNATRYGPTYLTCIEQVERCVTDAVEKSGKIGAVCPGPLEGCETMSVQRPAKRHFVLRAVRRFGSKKQRLDS